ncbi:MAG: translation elongation factor Ts [Gammaproteobacteria bacterium]|nr:translation elongation factor Ts [Gammaproteobacteria bacterium]MDH5652818.1 translation elongation factor Ts [Gammaproteobacteria bacterium]
MSITAAMVKELRERTGAGMMECKKALVETNGDIDAAIELMRKTGLAKADKKAGRTAAEGLVVIRMSDDAKTAAIVEVNCETDFVSKGDDFIAFAEGIADRALADKPADMEALLAAPLTAGSVEDTRKALIAKLGENMSVRRFAVMNAKGKFAGYMHGNRIGVLVDLEGGDETLGKDLAMHVAAGKPVCVDESEVPVELIEKEREIFEAQAAESGKPADIIAKMVDGRINKFLKEITLLGQPFVKDADQTVEKLLKAAGAKVAVFVRYEVGEGIEKKTENFADEVMAQVKGS